MKRTEVEEVLKDVNESQRKVIVDGIMNLHTIDAESHKKEIEAKDKELSTKDTKINDLANDVKKFDGVDVKEHQESVSNWEKKYNKDLSDEPKSNAIKLAVAKERPKNEMTLFRC